MDRAQAPGARAAGFEGCWLPPAPLCQCHCQFLAALVWMDDLYFDPSHQKRAAPSNSAQYEYDPRDPLAVPPEPSHAGRKRPRYDDVVVSGTRDTVAETLSIRGHRIVALRDDKLAQWIHAEQHLQPWMGREDLLVDRYDARLLLQDEQQIKKLKAFALQTPVDEDHSLRQQLDAERYRDLEVSAGGAKVEEAVATASTESTRTGATVNFAYSTSIAQTEPNDADREIMRRTASFVCSQPDGVSKAIDVLKFKNVRSRSGAAHLPTLVRSI